ncbi:MAG: hypothetical protein ACFFC9_12415, partial [Promethearchaeota archaeon]
EWSLYLNTLEDRHPKFRFYEVPTLSNGYRIMRFMIDGGMRAGIPNRKIRARTITTYINKSKFKKDLNIDSEDTIYLFLVDKKGEIIWRSEGEFEPKKAKQLEDLLTNYNG